MDCNPYFGAAGERGNSGHKRQQSFLWAEVDIFGGPGVMTADQSSGFGGDVGGLVEGGSCFWAALRWMVCGSGCAGVAVPFVTSMRKRSGRMISIPIRTRSDSRPMITMKQARPRASPHWRLRFGAFLRSGVVCRGHHGRPPRKASRDPIGRGIATTPRIPCRSLKRQCQ